VLLKAIGEAFVSDAVDQRDLESTLAGLRN